MTKSEKLTDLPNSGEYEEIIFDLPDVWRQESWNFVKFTKTDGINWCGEFREFCDHNFLIADLPNIGITCVVSGGHGYIIDVERKEKIKDLDIEPIIDIYADTETNTFYISSYWNIKIFSSDLIEIDLPIPIQCDGILFKGKDGCKLMLEIEELGSSELEFEVTKNIEYYIDLNDRKIKKNAV